MTKIDKNHLINQLAETHASIKAIIEEADLEIVVYTNSDWRIRDILGHIATWDRQATLSLQAFNAGEEYSIPDLDEDAFNQQEVLGKRKMTSQQVFEDWEETRDGFIAAIREASPDRFPGDMLYPWGDDRGSIKELVEFIVGHDIEHRDEIKTALSASSAE